ncbi:MAG: methyltransferase [Candidatus Nitronauta litoralis]|uniref:Methyltransferase n=1 Tax=Candidatus Nitronauta litoralis TaxID=2705533 RepID=A0A7T0G0G5_9BACT|nr:MAG: methyltransferase [Candidatus Nitronauta litoralis]
MSLVLDQNGTGYRFSMEPFLLADFVRPEAGSRCLEVGTGCSIIPLLLLTRQPKLLFRAIEIQESLIQKAQSNLADNNALDRVQLVHADFLEWSLAHLNETFDWVISNPPYRKLNSGRINPDREKALARHEITLTLESLVSRAEKHLNPGGKLCLAYPTERLEEVKQVLVSNGLQPVKVRKVFGNESLPARFFLILAERNLEEANCEEDRFFIYEKNGSYTSAMKSIYESFNYPGRSHRYREE